MSFVPSLTPKPLDKPEAKDPLGLSFFSFLSLAFNLSLYISLGAGLGLIAFLFKAPKGVEHFPLLADKGYVYWVKDKRPLGTEWIAKRKRLFEELGAKVRFSSLDLNAWAVQAFPKGNMDLRLAIRGADLSPFTDLSPFKNLLRLERPLAPSFCLQQEGIRISQPVILHVGASIALPVFAQALLEPKRVGGALQLDLKSLSLGWLPLPLERLNYVLLDKLSLSQLIMEFFYPSSKELSKLRYLFAQLLAIQLASDELLLIRKPAPPSH